MKDVDITDQGWDSSNNDIIGRRGRGRSWGRAGRGVPVGERAYQLQRNSEDLHYFMCVLNFPLYLFRVLVTNQSCFTVKDIHDTHTRTCIHKHTNKCLFPSAEDIREVLRNKDSNGESMGTCAEVSNCALTFCIPIQSQRSQYKLKYFSSCSS